jgi:hypothetical protein
MRSITPQETYKDVEFTFYASTYTVVPGLGGSSQTYNISYCSPVWRRVRILPPHSLRAVRGDKKGTQSQMRR